MTYWATQCSQFSVREVLWDGFGWWSETIKLAMCYPFKKQEATLKILLAILRWTADRGVKACLFFMQWVCKPANNLSLGTGQPDERRLLSLAKFAEEKSLFRKVQESGNWMYLFFSFIHPHVSPILSQLCVPQRFGHLSLRRKVVWPTKVFFLNFCSPYCWQKRYLSGKVIEFPLQTQVLALSQMDTGIWSALLFQFLGIEWRPSI